MCINDNDIYIYIHIIVIYIYIVIFIYIYINNIIYYDYIYTCVRVSRLHT